MRVWGTFPHPYLNTPLNDAQEALPIGPIALASCLLLEVCANGLKKKKNLHESKLHAHSYDAQQSLIHHCNLKQTGDTCKHIPLLLWLRTGLPVGEPSLDVEKLKVRTRGSALQNNSKKNVRKAFQVLIPCSHYG